MASACEAATATLSSNISYPTYLHSFLPAVQKTAVFALSHFPVSCSMPSVLDMNLYAYLAYIYLPVFAPI
jgi:GR25 family glycosyltransferase involved in LPS biosynthesis